MLRSIGLLIKPVTRLQTNLVGEVVSPLFYSILDLSPCNQQISITGMGDNASTIYNV